MVLQNKITCVPEFWRDMFGWKKVCYWSIVGEDDDWEGASSHGNLNSTKAKPMESKFFLKIVTFLIGLGGKFYTQTR